MDASQPAAKSQAQPSQSQTHAQWVRSAVNRYQDSLTLYASKILRESDLARDVVQETFLRLCAQDSAKIGDHLAEWLFTVCRNYALDVMRKDGRMSPISDGLQETLAHPGPSLAEALERKESAEHALELLERLPDNQREVIRLKFQHDFSYKQISNITGLSVSHVGVLIHLGLKTLRSRMANLEVMPAGIS